MTHHSTSIRDYSAFVWSFLFILIHFLNIHLFEQNGHPLPARRISSQTHENDGGQRSDQATTHLPVNYYLLNSFWKHYVQLICKTCGRLTCRIFRERKLLQGCVRNGVCLELYSKVSVVRITRRQMWLIKINKIPLPVFVLRHPSAENRWFDWCWSGSASLHAIFSFQWNYHWTFSIQSEPFRIIEKQLP